MFVSFIFSGIPYVHDSVCSRTLENKLILCRKALESIHVGQFTKFSAKKGEQWKSTCDDCVVHIEWNESIENVSVKVFDCQLEKIDFEGDVRLSRTNNFYISRGITNYSFFLLKKVADQNSFEVEEVAEFLPPLRQEPTTQDWDLLYENTTYTENLQGGHSLNDINLECGLESESSRSKIKQSCSQNNLDKKKRKNNNKSKIRKP